MHVVSADRLAIVLYGNFVGILSMATTDGKAIANRKNRSLRRIPGVEDISQVKNAAPRNQFRGGETQATGLSGLIWQIARWLVSVPPESAAIWEGQSINFETAAALQESDKTLN